MRARAEGQSHIGSIRRIDFARGFFARRAVRAVESRRHALRRLVIGEGGDIIPRDRDRFRRDIPRAGSQTRTRELIVHSRRRGDAYRGRIRADMERQTVRQAARRRREGILREDGVAFDHAREGDRRAVSSRRRVIGEVALHPRGQTERHLRDGEGFACRSERIRGARRIARKDIRGMRARIHLDVIREEVAVIAAVDQDVAVARDHIAVIRRHRRIGHRRRHGSRDRPIMTIILTAEDGSRRGRAVRHRPSVVIHALAGDHHVLRGRSGGEVIVIDESAVRAIREAAQGEGDVARRIQRDEDVLCSSISKGTRRGDGVIHRLLLAFELLAIEVLSARRGIKPILRETRRGQSVGQSLAAHESIEGDEIALIDGSARVHVRSRIRHAVEGGPSEVFSDLRDIECLNIADGNGTLIDRPRSRSACKGVVIIVARAARSERNARHAVRRHHAVVQIDVRRREGMRTVIADREGAAAIARGAEAERLVADDAADRQGPALIVTVVSKGVGRRPTRRQGLLIDRPSRRGRREGIVINQPRTVVGQGDRHAVLGGLCIHTGDREGTVRHRGRAETCRRRALAVRRHSGELQGLAADDAADRQGSALIVAVVRIGGSVDRPARRDRLSCDRPRSCLQVRGIIGRIARHRLRNKAVVRIAESGDRAVIGACIDRRRARDVRVAVMGDRQIAAIARNEVADRRRVGDLRLAVIGQARRAAPSDRNGLRLDRTVVIHSRHGTVDRIAGLRAVLTRLFESQSVFARRLNRVACGYPPSIVSSEIAAPNRRASERDRHQDLFRTRRRRNGQVTDRDAVVKLLGAALDVRIGIDASKQLIDGEVHHVRQSFRKVGDLAICHDAREIESRIAVGIVGRAAEVDATERVARDAGIARRTYERVVIRIARAVRDLEGDPVLTGVFDTVTRRRSGKRMIVIVIALVTFASTEAEELQRVRGKHDRLARDTRRDRRRQDQIHIRVGVGQGRRTVGIRGARRAAVVAGGPSDGEHLSRDRKGRRAVRDIVVRSVDARGSRRCRIVGACVRPSVRSGSVIDRDRVAGVDLIVVCRARAVCEGVGKRPGLAIVGRRESVAGTRRAVLRGRGIILRRPVQRDILLRDAPRSGSRLNRVVRADRRRRNRDAVRGRTVIPRREGVRKGVRDSCGCRRREGTVRDARAGVRDREGVARDDIREIHSHALLCGVVGVGATVIRPSDRNRTSGNVCGDRSRRSVAVHGVVGVREGVGDRLAGTDRRILEGCGQAEIVARADRTAVTREGRRIRAVVNLIHARHTRDGFGGDREGDGTLADRVGVARPLVVGSETCRSARAVHDGIDRDAVGADVDRAPQHFRIVRPIGRREAGRRDRVLITGLARIGRTRRLLVDEAEIFAGYDAVDVRLRRLLICAKGIGARMLSVVDLAIRMIDHDVELSLIDRHARGYVRDRVVRVGARHSDAIGADICGRRGERARRDFISQRTAFIRTCRSGSVVETVTCAFTRPNGG